MLAAASPWFTGESKEAIRVEIGSAPSQGSLYASSNGVAREGAALEAGDNVTWPYIVVYVPAVDPPGEEDESRSRYDSFTHIVVAPDGSTLPPASVQIAILCSPGFKLAGGVCVQCDVGTFNDGGGFDQPVCIPCEPGSSNGLTGQTACELCPVGTYQSAAGSAECTVRM